MITALTILAAGCDTFHVIKGTVLRPPDIAGTVQGGGSKPLEGVAVGVIGRARDGSYRTMSQGTSDREGRFELFFAGPRRLGSDDFVEFRKEGYKTRRLQLDKFGPNVEARHCPERTRGACIQLRIELSPER
jgi:hypothetical protein